MSARITQVDLLNEGIEEIIGAIVETEKDSIVWKKEIAPKTGIFDQLVPPCKSLDLFPWIDDVNRIRERVLEDIYGVHPMALSCLLHLSSEIGSDARSTFTFFSGDVGGEKGSYADFIENADVTVSSGKLNLYTVDQLFTFFSKELSQKKPGPPGPAAAVCQRLSRERGRTAQGHGRRVVWLSGRRANPGSQNDFDLSALSDPGQSGKHPVRSLLPEQL
jgi:hypothetical protein